MRLFSTRRTTKALSTTAASAAPADDQVAEHPGQRVRPGGARQDQQAEEQRRLGEAGEGRLARAAHALERRAGVERGGDGEEAPEPERVGEEDEVPVEAHGRRVAAERHEQGGEERGDQGDDRSGEEDPGGRAAEDHALARQLDEVEVRLEERRPDTAAEPGLGLDDDAEEERRQDEHQDDVDGDVDNEHGHLQRRSASSVTTM
jgi:hypothetical protein